MGNLWYSSSTISAIEGAYNRKIGGNLGKGKEKGRESEKGSSSSSKCMRDIVERDDDNVFS